MEKDNQILNSLHKQNMKTTQVLSSFFGFAVGDALGVPVEFMPREEISKNPVISMREYGTHHQPAGTWSDDSSMAFCLAESLCKNDELNYDLNDIANNFVKWYAEGFWAAHYKVFDIGIATSHALRRIKNGESPLVSGGSSDRDNGNGSLMRILPLIFYIKDKNITSRFQIVKEVYAITHAHIRSVLGCFIYTEFALQLLEGHEKYVAYRNMQKIVNDFLKEYNDNHANTNEIFPEIELNKYHRILENPINSELKYPIQSIEKYEEKEIYSSGYVVSTLEASIWCFIKTETYAESVLKAVNLGSDTDTVACVTGGIAGLYYGIEEIPQEWLTVIARKNDITLLAEKLAKVL
jgi:ADP-ribosyl-[dinitrogen reductase] hydrolase